MRIVSIKNVNITGSTIWIVILLIFAVITGISIAEREWICLGVVLIPFILYICNKKPFIFPFGFYVFLLPLDGVLAVMDFAKGATVTRFIGVLLILVLSVKGAFEKKLKPPDYAAVWMVMFVMFSGLSALWAIESRPIYGVLPSTISLLVLYLVTTSYQINRSEYETLKMFILVGGVFSAIISISLFLGGQSYAGVGGERATVELGESVINPNTLAYNLLFPFCICIQMILFKQNKPAWKWLFVFGFVILAFAIIVTGSRKNMLALGAILLVYGMFSKHKVKLIVACAIVGVGLFSFLPDAFFARWGEAVETGGDGRVTIWIVGFQALKKYILLGAGFGNFPYAYHEFANYSAIGEIGQYRAAHNLYLMIIVELGVIGFFIMLFTFWMHYKAIHQGNNRHDKDQIMLIAIFLASLVANIFAEFNLDKSYWLIWMMILMYRNVQNGSNYYTNSLRDRAGI